MVLRFAVYFNYKGLLYRLHFACTSLFYIFVVGIPFASSTPEFDIAQDPSFVHTFVAGTPFASSTTEFDIAQALVKVHFSPTSCGFLWIPATSLLSRRIRPRLLA